MCNSQAGRWRDKQLFGGDGGWRGKQQGGPNLPSPQDGQQFQQSKLSIPEAWAELTFQFSVAMCEATVVKLDNETAGIEASCVALRML